MSLLRGVGGPAALVLALALLAFAVALGGVAFAPSVVPLPLLLAVHPLTALVLRLGVRGSV